MRGPIDYVVVGFDGAKFDGSILSALGDAVQSGVIGFVAFSVFQKSPDGAILQLDVETMDDGAIAEFLARYEVDDEAIDADDLQEVAELVQDDTTIGLLIIEHLWAKPLKKALLDANGYLIADGRIHPEAARELETEEV